MAACLQLHAACRAKISMDTLRHFIDKVDEDGSNQPLGRSVRSAGSVRFYCERPKPARATGTYSEGCACLLVYLCVSAGSPISPVFSFSKLPSREPAVSDAPCSQGSTLGSQALRSWPWACEKNHHEGRGHVSLCVSQLRRFALEGKPFGMANMLNIMGKRLVTYYIGTTERFG